MSKAGSKAFNSSAIKSDRDVDVFIDVWITSWAITTLGLASRPVSCPLRWPGQRANAKSTNQVLTEIDDRCPRHDLTALHRYSEQPQTIATFGHNTQHNQTWCKLYVPRPLVSLVQVHSSRSRSTDSFLFLDVAIPRTELGPTASSL